MKIKISAQGLILCLMVSHVVSAQRVISMEEAISMANEGNRQVQISMLETRKATEQVKEINSGWKPVVNAVGNYQLYAERPVIFLRNDNGNNKVVDTKFGGTNAFNAAITGQQFLYNPLLNNQRKQSALQAEWYKEKSAQQKKTIALQTGERYLEILLYKEQLIHLANSKSRYEEALKHARMLFFQGKALATDTLNNAIAIHNLESSIFHVEVQVQSAMMDLKLLLGLPGEEQIDLSGLLNDRVEETFAWNDDSLKAMAASNRSDLKLSQLQVKLSDQQIRAVQAEFRPQVSAFGQYQLQSQSDQFDVWNYKFPRTSFIGVQVNVPIYSGGKQKFKQAQAQYAIEQAKISLQETESQSHKEVEVLKAMLRDAYMQKAAMEKTIHSAEISYKMFQQRYQFGMSTRLELTDAELQLTQAKLNHVQAIYMIRVKQLQLKHAIGL